MIPFTSAQTLAVVTEKSEKKESRSAELNLEKGFQQATFNDFTEYVTKHLEYPETARENAIEGTVKVKVTISPAGEVIAAKVLQPLGFGCDEAALKLVHNMPRWKPASNYGVPVTGKGILTFNFSLQ
jgi:TonB family protein